LWFFPLHFCCENFCQFNRNLQISPISYFLLKIFLQFNILNDYAESSRNDHCWWGKILINTSRTKALLNRLKLHRDHRLLQNITVTIDFHCDLIYSRLQRKWKRKKRILCFDAETSTKTAASANKLIRTCKWKRKYKESNFPQNAKRQKESLQTDLSSDWRER
jgi:hypothetical protein